MTNAVVADGHVVRPEIQALRAIAVLLVVFYHLWPNLLRGGYVGVDVFFVISGYLMTSHIVRGATGPIKFSLANFYARRIRRLLPASLLVLLIVAVVTLTMLPQTLWEQFGSQIVASAFYVENWVLATNSVDYLAAAADASPVQHFWSLSVEEQFYLVWPILIVALVAISVRRRLTSKRVVIIVLTVITALSFAFSVYQTAVDPGPAYFITPTRIWEFGAGGLLAIAFTTQALPVIARTLMAWAGLFLIGIPALLYTAATPFPGWTAAIPVVGTLLILAAGNVPSSVSPGPVFALRPVQWVGDISYSLYLWHWPLLVLLPVIVNGFGHKPSILMKLLVLVLSFGFAWASYRLVEQRFRRPKARSVRGFPRNVPVFMSALAGMLIIALVGGSVFLISASRAEAAETRLAQTVAEPPPCLGAAALPATAACEDLSTSSPVPDPIIAADDIPDQDCMQRHGQSEIIYCSFGVDDGIKVAMVGDSHANHWRPAIEAIAAEEGWSVSTFFKSLCPFSAVDTLDEACNQWNENVREEITAEGFDVVITSATASYDKFSRDDAVQGLQTQWQAVVDSGAQVVALADIPNPGRAGLTDPLSCIDQRGGGPCTVPESKALTADPLTRAQVEGSHLVDLNDHFCTGGTCQTVIGGVTAYSDANHMTATFSRTLAPALRDALRGVLQG